MSKFQPSTIKVGDAVLVGSSPERPRRIQKVQRVTETLFTLDNGDRYYRESGLRYGLMSGRILGLATPEDYVEQERCRQEAESEREARERADRYKKVLENLFARLPWHASITDDYNNRRGRFNLEDRKSTRLNYSHRCISYAVFCLKKKNSTQQGCSN